MRFVFCPFPFVVRSYVQRVEKGSFWIKMLLGLGQYFTIYASYDLMSGFAFLGKLIKLINLKAKLFYHGWNEIICLFV